MANIGTFTKAEDGTLNGFIKTLQLNTKAKFSPLDATSNGGPDFRIFAGNVEIGAAWKKVSQQDRPYISVKLDDPSLAGSDLRLPLRGRRARPVQHDLDPREGEVTDRPPRNFRGGLRPFLEEEGRPGTDEPAGSRGERPAVRSLTRALLRKPSP